MKNLSFLWLILPALLLAACIKETLPVAPNGGSTTNKTVSTPNDTTANTTAPVVPIDSTMLVGTWQVINDTTNTVGWGLWAGHPPIGSNYVGKPEDYYKFTANNNLYSDMQAVIDTGTYTVVNQDQLHIVYSYFNGQEQSTGIYNSFWTITNLTLHTASITVVFVTPETVITSVTNLRK